MRGMNRALIFAIVLLVMPICSHANRATNVEVIGFEDYGDVGYPLHGAVVFVNTLNPAAGVTLEVFTRDGTRISSTTTDAKGEFYLPNLKEGSYSVVGIGDHVKFEIQAMFRISKSAKSVLCLIALPR